MDDTRYRIIEELRPGILTDLVRLHMNFYGPERGLGERFEAGLIDGFAHVWLTTFPGLESARHLYEAHGFVLAEEHTEDHWGGGQGEQTFLRRSNAPPHKGNGPP
jgi:hypothetical protein